MERLRTELAILLEEAALTAVASGPELSCSSQQSEGLDQVQRMHKWTDEWQVQIGKQVDQQMAAGIDCINREDGANWQALGQPGTFCCWPSMYTLSG